MQNDNLAETNRTTETLLQIFVAALRQRGTNTDEIDQDELSPAVLTGIKHLAKWYKSVPEPDDDRAATCIEMLEVLAADPDTFFDELETLVDNDQLAASDVDLFREGDYQ